MKKFLGDIAGAFGAVIVAVAVMAGSNAYAFGGGSGGPPPPPPCANPKCAKDTDNNGCAQGTLNVYKCTVPSGSTRSCGCQTVGLSFGNMGCECPN